jgi:hypothetical protein
MNILMTVIREKPPITILPVWTLKMYEAPAIPTIAPGDMITKALSRFAHLICAKLAKEDVIDSQDIGLKAIIT